MSGTRYFLAVLLIASLAGQGAALAAAGPGAEDVIRTGLTRGICVLVNDRGCKLALDLASKSELTILVHLTGAEDVEAASRAADGAGLYGTRIFVEKGAPTRIHLGDNLADVVVAAGSPRRGDAPAVADAEVLRVLRPGGKALLGKRELTKPFPKGVDDWSHHYHGPDNNPQSTDRLARAPYLTQFIAEPRFGTAPQAAVASAGRLFLALGHVAWHRREERWLNTLVALNGFNGAVLWKRPLTPGIMVDRSTLIATPETLFFADEKSCKLIDAATGKVAGEIAPPADVAGGTFWKWMAFDPAAGSGGVLYALVGAEEPLDPVERWRRARHGWPWGGISKGYNQRQYAWGFGKTLLAIDPKTKKTLWRHQAETPIDSRGICMSSGRIYLCSFGKCLACLDAKTGGEVWRRTIEKDPDLFKEIGPYRAGHGYIGGWKSTVYLKCTDKALYFVGPQVNWLTAVSAKDGTFMWKFPKKDLHVVIRDDGLYTIGSEKSGGRDTKKLDPLTGEVLASYAVHRRACTRSTGSPDGILFRAPGGSARLDLATGKSQWISPMRPSCLTGVIIASGLLYWVPWPCDCNLQMTSLICNGPAGDFDFARRADERERLEKSAGAKAEVAEFRLSPADWPTYRANNARTARTQAKIPPRAELLWTFAPKRASTPTAPVAAGGLVFLGGADGIVRALDAAGGQLRWKAYTGGAVRFPPTLAPAGRALVGSGDGWVYAFEAATGRLCWRFRAAPVERKMPVYGALMSTWPVTSGVLVADGAAYFAAGINDYDGTHVYALDAASGRLKWHNGGSGHLERFSRRGVAAQGEMLLHEGKLYLAGGNAASPGVYEVAGGKCLTPRPKGMGSRARRGRELRLLNGRVTVSGQPFYATPEFEIFDGSARWNSPVVAAANANLLCVQRKDAKSPTWALIAQDSTNGAQLWEQRLPGPPVRWGTAVDAGGRVVVVLRDGRVLCFGEKGGAPRAAQL